MKKLRNLIILVVVLVLTAGNILAQEESSPRFVVKTNPMAALGGPIWISIIPITGEYKVLFEARTLEKQSVTVGVSALGPSLLLNLDEITSSTSDVSGINTAGFRVQGTYKLFISRNTSAPEGFYVGPNVSYAMANITSKDVSTDKIQATKLNFNGLIGYQLITDGGFALDIYTGLGLKSIKWSYEGNSATEFDLGVANKNSPSVAFGMAFGYAF